MSRYKVDSSLGRIFIYKISSRIYEQNWLSGIGYGQFKNIYLLYQADYFKVEKFTLKELLLADNTYYAFNDYWQFVIETGIIGWLTIILVFLTLGLSIHRYMNAGKIHFFCSLAIIFILMISVAALFTHVFEKVFFQLLFLVSFSTLLYNHPSSKAMRSLAFFSMIMTCVIFSTFCFSIFRKVGAQDNFNDVKDLHLFGLSNTSYRELGQLKAKLKDDPAFLSTYAQVCEYQGRYNEAIFTYGKLLDLRKSNTTYMRIGKCYEKLSDNKAEKFYLTAIFMVPNRLGTRKALLDYYIKQGDDLKALKTAQALLTIPVKVHSEKSEFIRAYAIKKIRSISQN